MTIRSIGKSERGDVMSNIIQFNKRKKYKQPKVKVILYMNPSKITHTLHVNNHLVFYENMPEHGGSCYE